jgi:hypothetical protein
MGDRGQVKIIAQGNPDLYFYTHWCAEFLPETVANALARGRGRWVDEEYLSRIIFSEMIQGEVLEETGYGIGFGEHGDVWRVVEINYDNKTVAIRELDYDNWNVEDGIDSIEWSYTVDPMPYDLFIDSYATK